MLLLIRMLNELLDKTNMTFQDLSLLMGRLWKVGRPCDAKDTEAFRAWLRALTEALLESSPAMGQDARLVAWARRLTGDRWSATRQLWSVFEAAEELPAPDSAAVQSIVGGMAGDGVDAGRGAMLCFTLAALERLRRR